MLHSVSSTDAREWADLVSRHFIPLNVRVPHSTFEGQLSARDLGSGVTVSKVTNSVSAISRRPVDAVADGANDVLLLTPLEGTLWVTQGGRPQQVEVGTATLHDASRPYVLNFPKPACMIVTQLPRDLLPAGLMRDLGTNLQPIKRQLVSPLRAMLAACLSDSQELSASDAGALQTALTSLTLALLMQASPPDSALLTQAAAAQRLIATQCYRSDFTPSILAEQMHVSLRQLQLAFSSVGDSPAAAIRRVRVERATEHLKSPWGRSASVADIASAVGLEEGTLRRAFKRHHGVALQQFRSSPPAPPNLCLDIKNLDASG